MIKQIPTERFEDRLIHTFSDRGLKIRQIETGEIYDETDDVIPCRYTYEEVEGSDEEVSDEEILARVKEVMGYE